MLWITAIRAGQGATVVDMFDSATLARPIRTIRQPAREWQQWWTAQAVGADPLLAFAARRGLVLSTAERTALGVSRSRARHAVLRGRWTAAGHGYVAPLDVSVPTDPAQPDRLDADRLERRRRHTLESCGSARRRPNATVTGRSAAILRGLPTMHIPSTPELTDPDVGQGRRRSTHLYAATLHDDECDRWYGVRVEAVARTLVTLARHGRRDAIMAADAALREGLVDQRQIERALTVAVGWPWVRQARAVLALADPRAESPLESITRLALIDAGFPEPELQVPFGPFDVDFYWPKYGLVLEADGAGKYIGKAWTKEKQRERELLRYAAITDIERVVWSDIVTSWPETERRLAPYFR